MLEVIADAPFLAQALEEGEVALVELGLVVARRIVLGQAPAHGKGIAREQGLEDLHDRQVLEDPAVGAQFGQVQPGPQCQQVLGVAARLAEKGRLSDERVDLAHAVQPVVERDAAVDLAADEGIEVEVGVIGRLEQQFVAKQRIQALAARQPHGPQRGLAIDKGKRRPGDRQRARQIRHRRDLQQNEVAQCASAIAFALRTMVAPAPPGGPQRAAVPPSCRTWSA